MAAAPTSGIHTPRGTAFLEPGIGYIVPGADYWTVEMECRDYSDGPSLTLFPSEGSAHRFATAHKEQDPYRKIAVLYPDGYAFDLDTV